MVQEQALLDGCLRKGAVLLDALLRPNEGQTGVGIRHEDLALLAGLLIYFGVGDAGSDPRKKILCQRLVHTAGMLCCLMYCFIALAKPKTAQQLLCPRPPAA